MKKWKNRSKKQKTLIAAAMIVLLVTGSAAGIKVYADAQQKEAVAVAMEALKEDKQVYEDLLERAELLVENDFLVKDLNKEELTELETQFSKLVLPTITLTDDGLLKEELVVNEMDQELAEMLVSIRKEVEAQESVNTLFAATAINGAEVKKDLAIADKVSAETVEGVQSSLQQAGELSRSFTLDSEDTEAIHQLKDSKWFAEMTDLVGKAQEQVKQIEDLTSKVESYYKDGKPQKDGKRKEIVAVKKEVESIKNETSRKDLTEKIDKVLAEVDKKAKTEAEEKAAAEGGTVEKKEDGSYEVVAQVPVETKNTTYSESTESGNNGYTAPASNNSNNTYTPPASNGGGNSNNTAPTANNGGTTTPPASNSGSENTSGSNSGGTWSGEGDVQWGGEISPGKPGSATWEGGEFDGSGIPEW